MVYTLESDKIEIVAFVLDVFTHEDYNKRFGFKGKQRLRVSILRNPLLNLWQLISFTSFRKFFLFS